MLARELGLTRPAAHVLAARGYGSVEAAKAFLEPGWDQLHAPERLRDLPAAADRLARAVTGGEKILLYGDYDVDGTMSVVILTKAIELCGGASSYHIPHRVTEGYGMRPEVVERAAADGVRLIVSVDTGIRASLVVQHARQLGIDTIVTDHHLPEDALPPAVAVVNPNRPDCAYPNKDLCGAGVAFKLAQALMSRQGWPGDRLRRVLDSFLKLAAIATVADVVPVTGENRAIVAMGLDGLRDVRNLGLRELIKVAGLPEGRPLSVWQVGFQIGPRINAAGRMESARRVIELFRTDDSNEAGRIAKELDSLNLERREAEKSILEEILKQIDEPPAGIVRAAEGWHRGVVGIVASRVVERFYRPTFVLEIDAATGTATGSGRSIAPYHLLNGLESMRDLFIKFGGHSHAAGVTLDASRVDEFAERFSRHVRESVSDEDLIPVRRIDAEVSASEMTEAAMRDLARLAPFGTANPAPVLMLRGAAVEAQWPMGASGKHFKLRVNNNRTQVMMKAFDFADRLDEIMPGRRIDVAFTVEEDEKWGWSSTVRDVRAA